MEEIPSKPEGPSLYQPLNTGERLEIRLLTVLPGSAEDPIECALRTVSLDNPPEYNSVSYVWGNGNECSTIRVSNAETGKSHEISVPISAAQSIRRLRLEHKPHTLWIDAVCIHQADLSERSHQVANMRSVYAKAKANLIQLGHAAFDTATQAICSVKAVVKEIHDESSAFGGLRSALYQNREPVNMGDPLRAALHIDALASLLSSRWFKRLWVMQEAVSAQHNVCHFGEMTFDLIDLLRACIWMAFKRQTCPLRIRETIGLRVCSKLWPYVDRVHGTYRKRKGGSVSSALDFARGLEVTDPRDRVFAVLGLMKCNQTGDLPHQLTPDYSKPLLEVYRNATGFAVQEKGIGPMFSRIHQWTEGDVRDEYWPSWVPRLERERDANMEASSLPDLFAPDSGLKQAALLPPTISSEGTLSVPGIVADAVQDCTPVLVKSEGVLARQGWLKAAEQIASDNDHDRITLAHTLIAGANAYFQLDSVPADFEVWWSLVFEGREMPQDVGSLPLHAPIRDRNAAKFELAFSYASNVRRFFSTGEGKIGLGPSTLRRSDQVVVLHGGKTPFILRPIDLGYKLLGQCYVHGIMQGEAVQEQRSKLRSHVRVKLR